MRKPKSEIAEAVHETARGLYRVGLIDKERMQEYDRLCLQPLEPLDPESIKKNRHRLIEIDCHEETEIEDP
jgi:putative transcriptional regulator